MATINGVTFNLQDYSTRISKRTKPQASAGNGRNMVISYGNSYEITQIQINGAEFSREDYNEVMNAFFASGEKELVLNNGWKLYVFDAYKNHNERAFVAEDTWLPYDITLYSEEPYEYSETTYDRLKTQLQNGDTWTEDDSSNDIATVGEFDLEPVIKITAEETAKIRSEQTGTW